MATSPTATSSTSSSSQINQLLGANASTASSKANEASDRFLKLLTTQLMNQDPLNPMDNAQITSQTAQINTVTSLEKLNTAMAQVSSMLGQLQAMQGVSLVGKDVMVAGNAIRPDANGVAKAAFDLPGPADACIVEVKTPAGKVIDTIDLGAVSAGRQTFDWTAPKGAPAGLTFNVTARAAGTTLTVSPMQVDHVESVYSDNGTLKLELAKAGSVSYSDVKGVL